MYVASCTVLAMPFAAHYKLLHWEDTAGVRQLNACTIPAASYDRGGSPILPRVVVTAAFTAFVLHIAHVEARGKVSEVKGDLGLEIWR